MHIHELSAHGYQLTRLALFNCYLVRESDGYTLIDTGLPGSAESLLDCARACGIGEIQRILLTHAHSDHIGSLDRLAHLLGKVDIAISHCEARLLPKKPAQDRSLDPGEPQCPVKGGFSGAKSTPTHLLSDGELYGSLRCIATPGHTPGHFSFLDERDGTLYAGDALTTVGGRPHVSGWAPWYFPLPNFATWHRPNAKASVQRLHELAQKVRIRCLAPGHGPMLPAGPPVFKAALNETR